MLVLLLAKTHKSNEINDKHTKIWDEIDYKTIIIN